MTRTTDSSLDISNACPAGIDALSTARVGDGRWLVLSSGSDTVRYWPVDAEDLSGASAHKYTGPGSVSSLAVARLPDNRDVVVGRAGIGLMMRWDVTRGGLPDVEIKRPALETFPLGRAPLVVVEAPAGPLAVTDCVNGGIRLWDVGGMAEAGEAFGVDAGAVWSLGVGTLPDGRPVVVSGGADRLVHRWDPLTGAELGAPISGCGRAAAIAITELPEGRGVICVLSTKGNIHRRDLLTGEPLGEQVRTGWQPGKYVSVCAGLLAAGSAGDGGVIAACTAPQSVRAWDLASGALLWELPDMASKVTGLGIACLPDGAPVIVAGDSDGLVQRFDAASGRPLGKAVWPHGWGAGVVLPTAAPDGRVIVSAGRDRSVRSFDARTGKPVGRLWRAPAYGLASAALPGGRALLAAGGPDGMACEELLSGTARVSWRGVTMWDIAVAAVPGGRTIIAGAGQDSRVYRWDGATGEMIGEPLRGHGTSVKAVVSARQEDGTPVFITGCEAGRVLRWDAASGERAGAPLSGTMGPVDDLGIVDLPDGRQVLAGVDHDALYRWDPVTGGELGPPITVGDRARILSAHVDEGGAPVAFLWIRGKGDRKGGRVAEWRLDTGRQVRRRLPGTLRAVFYDSGVRWMVLANSDGSLAIRPLPKAAQAPTAVESAAVNHRRDGEPLF